MKIIDSISTVSNKYISKKFQNSFQSDIAKVREEPIIEEGGVTDDTKEIMIQMKRIRMDMILM